MFFGSYGSARLSTWSRSASQSGVVGLVVSKIECLPALQCDLKRADVGLAAVGLVAGQHGEALVMNLQITRIGHVEILARRIVGDVLLKGMRDQRQAARHCARGVNHPHPVGAGFSVERPGVVVDAIDEETRAPRVALERSRSAPLFKYPRVVNCDGWQAMQSWVSECCITVRSATAPRRGVFESQLSPMLTMKSIPARTARCGSVYGGTGYSISVQLVSRVIGSHSHVVFLPGLKNAGTEFVESRIILGRLNLIDKFSGGEGNHVRLSGGVLAQLKNIHVERDIAVGHVEHEVDQRAAAFHGK